MVLRCRPCLDRVAEFADSGFEVKRTSEQNTIYPKHSIAVERRLAFVTSLTF